MIKFNELRITPDGKSLIIDASIENLPYYKDVYIDSVIIDTQDTYVMSGPSNNPVFTHTMPEDHMDSIYSIPEYTGCCPVKEEVSEANCFVENSLHGEKNVRLELNSTALGKSLCENMFFVYIIARGTPSADTPCGMDNSITMGIAINFYPYYRSMMYGLKDIEDNCSIPKNFINNILRFKAVELSIKTGNYSQAIKYWKKFFLGIKNNNNVNTGCNCHG